MKAVVVNKSDEQYTCSLAHVDEANLPAGDVTINVEYSSLNCKDGLAMTRRSPVVRSFPMVPGIDLAGIASASSDGAIRCGDHVLVNGRGMGETCWGGYAEKARVSGDMITTLPGKFSSREAMAIGTAGYTARQRGGCSFELAQAPLAKLSRHTGQAQTCIRAGWSATWMQATPLASRMVCGIASDIEGRWLELHRQACNSAANSTAIDASTVIVQSLVIGERK